MSARRKELNEIVLNNTIEHPIPIPVSTSGATKSEKVTSIHRQPTLQTLLGNLSISNRRDTA